MEATTRTNDEQQRLLREANEYIAQHETNQKRKHRREEDSFSDDPKQHSRKKRSKKEKKKGSKKKKESSKTHNKKQQQRSSRRIMDLGDFVGHAPNILLDAERDYFAYHQHFWVYLYREEQRTFEDMEDTQQSRQAFARFVQRYNAGKLEHVYYQGSTMPPEVWDECKATRHQWKFQTTKTEEESLSFVQDGVRKQTEYTNEEE